MRRTWRPPRRSSPDTSPPHMPGTSHTSGSTGPRSVAPASRQVQPRPAYGQRPISAVRTHPRRQPPAWLIKRPVEPHPARLAKLAGSPQPIPTARQIQTRPTVLRGILRAVPALRVRRQNTVRRLVLADPTRPACSTRPLRPAPTATQELPGRTLHHRSSIGTARAVGVLVTRTHTPHILTRPARLARRADACIPRPAVDPVSLACIAARRRSKVKACPARRVHLRPACRNLELPSPTCLCTCRAVAALPVCRCSALLRHIFTRPAHPTRGAVAVLGRGAFACHVLHTRTHFARRADRVHPVSAPPGLVIPRRALARRVQDPGGAHRTLHTLGIQIVPPAILQELIGPTVLPLVVAARPAASVPHARTRRCLVQTRPTLTAGLARAVTTATTPGQECPRGAGRREGRATPALPVADQRAV
eukprot:764067-Hanusia_phi.AAC.3